MKAPQSLASERSVLGGLLLDCKQYPIIEDKLCVEDFTSMTHKKIFHIMGILWDESQVFDAHLVSEKLPELKETIFRLANNTPSVANIKAYCDIVREKSVQRKLIEVATDIAASAKNGGTKEIGKLLDDAERKVREVYEEERCPAQDHLVSFFMELTNELDNVDLTEEYLAHTIVEVNKALVDTLRHVEGEHEEQ